MPSTTQATFSWNWCRRGTSRNGSAPRAPASAASSRRPASARPRGGKETRRIDDRDYVLEYPIRADFALIKALKADRWGNLVYRKTARNFGPIMASAARCAIVQVDEVVALGDLDPECIVTPGIHVQRVVQIHGDRPPAVAAPQREA
jgi:acyl CoA:acetate/3-ketoacid CoA transferase alpha subunit